MRYCVYGLILSSSIPFPELRPLAVGRATLRFRLATGPIDARGWREEAPRLQSDGEPWLIVSRRDRAYRLRFGDAADFVLSADGRTLVGYRRGRTPLTTVRHLALDQALPLVLAHRGNTVLHASAFVHDGGAVALLGPAGAGKSTLTASFGTDGAAIIADDAVVLRQRGDVLVTLPAYPGLRVWPDALTAMGYSGRGTRVKRASTKLRIGPGDVPLTFADRPMPLRSLSLLERAGRTSRVRIDVLSRREALLELLKCCYALDITDRGKLVEHLDRLTRDCLSLAIRRITYPNDLRVLPRVRAAMLEDLRTG